MLAAGHLHDPLAAVLTLWDEREMKGEASDDDGDWKITFYLNINKNIKSRLNLSSKEARLIDTYYALYFLSWMLC